MSDVQTITPSIYRLDLNKVRYLVGKKDADITAKNVDEHILAYQAKQRQQGYSKAKPFQKKLGPLQVGGYSVTVYGTDAAASKPHAWKNLFGEEIPGLDVKYPNLAAFISTNDTCYAISAGQGQTLFDQFVDGSFPLEVAKHIMKPELSSTERREIAGAIYGQMQQYRTSQMMVSSQTLGTVWRTLKGEITEEVKNSAEFDTIFHPDKRSISVVAGSSLTISRKVDVAKIIELLDWLVKILDEELTKEQEENFNFLNGLKEIPARRGKADITELKKCLADQLYTDLANPHIIDFDYSHKNFVLYQEAKEYNFGTARQLKDVTWNVPPTAAEVMAALKDNNHFDGCKSGADMLDVLDKTVFFAENDDSTRTVSASILAHLHGEVEYKKQQYFLVDGTWYQAPAKFLKRLAGDFKKLLDGEHFVSPQVDFALKPYAHKGEGKYNESYIGQDNWLVADRVFMSNVEIADLFYWKDGKFYIVHNKLGFGVTVRDVCSQIFNSMSIVSRMDKPQLKDYYKRIIKRYYKGKTPPISEDAFVDLFLKTKGKDIIYVIGYAQKEPVKATTRSNIAKFEAVKLCNTDRKQFDFDLKIVHIPTL